MWLEKGGPEEVIEGFDGRTELQFAPVERQSHRGADKKDNEETRKDDSAVRILPPAHRKLREKRQRNHYGLCELLQAPRNIW